MLSNAAVFFGLVAVVALVMALLRTPPGRRVAEFLPTPFWIYFIAILFGSAGVFPAASPVYEWVGLQLLAAALVLMLIGTPVPQLLRLGPVALETTLYAGLTMVIAMLTAFALFAHALPAGAWRGAGALLATWIGGSANMLTVKEIFNMPDSDLAPLVVVDTLLSYSWLALLMAGAGVQNRWDGWVRARGGDEVAVAPAPSSARRGSGGAARTALLLAFAFAMAYAMIAVARGVTGPSGAAFAKRWGLGAAITALNAKGWALLLVSTVTVALAATPLRRLEDGRASKMGTLLLYVVLVNIGIKSSLGAAFQSPIYLLFGTVVLALHGVLLLALGRFRRLPLSFLAVASQADVGGAVSAPIVAGVYRPSIAQISVLMAIFGALAGTLVGTAGGWVCRWIAGR